MNELIKIENNEMVLNSQVELQLVALEKRIEALQEKQSKIKESIKQAMVENNIVKFEDDIVLINNIPPTTREAFNSKKFRKDNPDLYDEYVEIKNVSGSIRFKFK